MSDLIKTTSGLPFATKPAAKRKLIELEKLGMNVAIVDVDGGYAIKDLADGTTPQTLGDLSKQERRPKRVPLATRNVLTVHGRDKDPDYEYRFVNDQDERIRDFEAAGWSVVSKKIAVGDKGAGRETAVGTPVSKTKGGTKSILMRIRKDWYKEDQGKKQQEVTKNERAMKQQSDKKGQYGKVDIGR